MYPAVASAVADTRPSYVVIATDTQKHRTSVEELSSAGYDGLLMVEKPLMTAPSAFDQFERVGVGYNLRFHPVILRLKEILSVSEIYTVEVYAGQHLSSWRPGRPVQEQYSSSLDRGGGVLRDLSHEFDYLTLMLGRCLGIFARGGRLARLTEDSDDAWGMVAHYERAPVLTLQLNYLDSLGRRRIVANTSVGTVEADLVAGTVAFEGEVEAFASDRNSTYRAMHRAMLSGNPVATVLEASDTDDVIGMVERSKTERKWIERQ